jgi:hypothetical protein
LRTIRHNHFVAFLYSILVWKLIFKFYFCASYSLWKHFQELKVFMGTFLSVFAAVWAKISLKITVSSTKMKCWSSSLRTRNFKFYKTELDYFFVVVMLKKFHKQIWFVDFRYSISWTLFVIQTLLSNIKTLSSDVIN